MVVDAAKRAVMQTAWEKKEESKKLHIRAICERDRLLVELDSINSQLEEEVLPSYVDRVSLISAANVARGKYNGACHEVGNARSEFLKDVAALRDAERDIRNKGYCPNSARLGKCEKCSTRDCCREES